MTDFHPLFLPTLKRWETYQQAAYVDKGKDKPLAIGYGTRQHNSSGFQFDASTKLRDEAHAMELLMADIEQQFSPQLDDLFKKIEFTAPTSGFYCGFLDALYNRGYGRIRGSLAYDWLKHPERERYQIYAAIALSHPHFTHEYVTATMAGKNPAQVIPDEFIRLDVAWDAVLEMDRCYPGLMGRRAADTTLCLADRF